MREKGKLLLILVFVTIIVIFGFLVVDFFQNSGNLIVENYKVELSPDGNLTETYEFNVGVSGEYRMLYRDWDNDVTYNSNLNSPHIEVTYVSCPFIPYVKDYRGDVEILSGSSNYDSFIKSKAFNNEIGCYNPNYFNKGKYELKIDYKIIPPVEYDDEYYHINIKLTEEHITYKNVRIVINDPENDIFKLYTHPHMDITKSNSKYVITGSSPSNNLIEFEIVSKNIKYGYKSYEENILETTESANNYYDLGYSIFTILNYILLVLTFGFALILLFIYYLKGKEEDYVVPEYISFVPKKRKPWIVNLVFKEPEHKIDENALYSTLLDFHNRKIITLKNSDGSLEIKINQTSEELDEYEKRVFSFIERWSNNNVFNLDNFASKISNRQFGLSTINEINKDMNYLKKTAKSDLLKDFFISSRRYPLIFTFLSIILLPLLFFSFIKWASIYPMIIQTLILSLILLIQSLIAYSTPPALFGHWKEDYYKEKLEWDSFRDFLSDMAQLKKYEMQDIIIWEEWLVYGTALGVGKKVAKAMEKLNINIHQANFVPLMYGSFYSVNNAIISTRQGSGGSHGGGSFGGGGGFGGGGAGGR